MIIDGITTTSGVVIDTTELETLNVVPQNIYYSAVKVSDGTSEQNGSAGNTKFYSLAYIDVPMEPSDVVMLNFRGSSQTQWWTQGRAIAIAGWAYSTDGGTTKNDITNEHLQAVTGISGDVNNLPGNFFIHNISESFIYESTITATIRFYRTSYCSYWQDINGAFYPFGVVGSKHQMQAFKLRSKS